MSASKCCRSTVIQKCLLSHCQRASTQSASDYKFMLLLTGKAAMKANLAAILIYICNVIYLVYAKRSMSYYVTTFTSNIQDSKSNTSKPLDYHFRYKNLSVDTRFIELPRTSGLSQLISSFPSYSLQNGTAKDGEDIFHLSYINEGKKKILKEVFWKRKQVSSDVTKCSQVSTFFDYRIHDEFVQYEFDLSGLLYSCFYPLLY